MWYNLWHFISMQLWVLSNSAEHSKCNFFCIDSIRSFNPFPSQWIGKFSIDLTCILHNHYEYANNLFLYRLFLLLQNHSFVDRQTVKEIDCCVNEFIFGIKSSRRFFFIVNRHLFVHWLEHVLHSNLHAHEALLLLGVWLKSVMKEQSPTVAVMLNSCYFVKSSSCVSFCIFNKKYYQKRNKPLKIMAFITTKHIAIQQNKRTEMLEKNTSSDGRKNDPPPSEMVKWIYSDLIKMWKKWSCFYRIYQSKQRTNFFSVLSLLFENKKKSEFPLSDRCKTLFILLTYKGHNIDLNIKIPMQMSNPTKQVYRSCVGSTMLTDRKSNEVNRIVVTWTSES